MNTVGLLPLHKYANSSVEAPLPTIMVVPSGIGCSIGGYAGDAIPAARLLAAASGCLITHPNVLNGGTLFWPDSRLHYVEGYALDQFAIGEIALRPVRQQRVGVILDAAIEPELRSRNLQVVDGCRATLGLNVGPVITTETPLDVRLNIGESGASWGSIGEPKALLKAGESLQRAGATAIAVIARFPDGEEDLAFERYRKGEGVDALAGAEAIISHLLVRHLGIPCAHSPALAPLELDTSVDPRAVAEELGYSFLTSVLVGLSKAPDIVLLTSSSEEAKRDYARIIKVEDLGAIVAPDGALGGEAVLACIEKGIPLISVDNPGVLGVNCETLGLKQESQPSRGYSLIRAKNYLEAAGVLMLLREGISLEALQRPMLATENMLKGSE